MKLKSTNPAKNYEKVGKVEISSREKIKQAVSRAQQAKEKWGAFSVEKRCQLIQKLATLIEDQQEEIAHLITTEMGKTIRQAREETQDCSRTILDFCAQARKYLQEKIVYEDKYTIGKVVLEPWGVCAVITPWNYPMEMAIWGIVPNLLCGNTVVFKPSEETPLCGQRLASLIARLNLPKGVFNIIQGAGNVGSQLVDSDINYVWFTGSTKVGQEIYAKAGKKFIKATLELGGSSPAVIFPDVKVDDVMDDIYYQRFSNCGQMCSAIKRLIVHRSILNEVVTKLTARLRKVRVGDPKDEKTDIGSLVAKRQLILLEAQVKDAVKKGAKIIIGGKRPENLAGAYYDPTILTNIKKDMRVYQEEVFGPVLPIMPFSSAEEAIKLANDTIYGLTAVVFTKDNKLADEMARKIQAGRIGVNNAQYFKSSCPFGGYKKSGLGREHGEYGFLELSQIKHIHYQK